MSSFREETQDVLTRWLLKGVHPLDLRTILLDLCGDLQRMADLKAEVEGGPLNANGDRNND